MMRVRPIAFPFALALAALASCDRGAPPAATPAPVAAPSASAAPAPAPLFVSADVDAKLRAEWKAAGVEPCSPADDATWLRRAWLDVVGTIPPSEVVTQFLADKAPGTRARAVEELLASPRWADHWAAYWDDVWMGRGTRAPDVDRGAFRAWLHDAFARNKPWNQIVTELLTATGANSDGGSLKDAYANEGRTVAAEGINGAVNWTLRYQQNPQDMAGTASRTLLGVQIQCAQCHDHKTEKWTQADFQRFAAAFVRTRLVKLDDGKMKGQVVRIEVHDLPHPAPRFAKMGDLESILKATPTAIDGTDLSSGEGVRATLAAWVTSPKNPYFARAFVNRMWGHFLGRGFSDPVDDLRPSNPPAAPALLDALAADFVASGYDVKHLVRLIVDSEAYGLSAAPVADATAKADPELKLWERFRVTPLGPEELLNALVAATKLDTVVRALRDTTRLDLDEVRFRVKQRYGFLFDVDEDSDESDYDGTIAQGLALLNGGVVAAGSSALPASALSDLLAMPGSDAERIESLYVRVLGRYPSADESITWTRFLADAPEPSTAAVPPKPKQHKPGEKPPGPDPLRPLEARAAHEHADGHARAYEDLLWVLLNSSEFVLNH
jgi:hypothetical protein